MEDTAQVDGVQKDIVIITCWLGDNGRVIHFVADCSKHDVIFGGAVREAVAAVGGLPSNSHTPGQYAVL